MATEFNLFDLGLTEDDTYLITATAKAEGRETSESSNIAEWTLSSETWMFIRTSSRPIPPTPIGASIIFMPWVSENYSGNYVALDIYLSSNRLQFASSNIPGTAPDIQWVYEDNEKSVMGDTTVRFLKPPTGDVLTWLETNASKM